MLDNVLLDLNYSVRTFRKNPMFVTTAIVTLALAIGGNTAMFSVIRAVLLKPLPYRDSDRLVNMAGGATPERFREIREGAKSFSAVGAYTGEENLTLSGATESEVLKGTRVSADFLSILGVEPVLGRGFRQDEDGPGGAPVALISSELWKRRFAGDAKIAGKQMDLSSTTYTIIGVLPARFEFPSAGIDLWLTDPSDWPLIPLKSRLLSPILSVFGRLKPGVKMQQADAEMRLLRSQYAAAHPAMLDAKAKKPVELAAMKDELVSKVRSMLWLLFGAVGFVLTIASANVANLLLTRATARRREFAVRTALGARRSRLISQLLAESILLSAAGGAIGVCLAVASVRAVPSISALHIPRATEIQIDWVVVGFACAISLASGVIFGLAPSLSASRPDLIQVLRASGEAGGQSSSLRRGLGRISVRSLLSVGQVALSIVLLIGATLLIESLAFLRNVDVGFNPSHLLTGSISLPPLRYDTNKKQANFFEQLVKQMSSLPGVSSATAAMFLPMNGAAGTPVQDAAKPPLRLNERQIATFVPVANGYFHTLEIPFKSGRDFNDHDTADALRVVIINEAAARHFWPNYPQGLNPIGQRLLIGGVNAKPATIVGVVADVHQNLDDREDWKECVYVAFAQNPNTFASLAVRTNGDPLSFTKAVREQIRALDPQQAISDVQTMDSLVDDQVGQRKLLVILLGAFAGMSVFLALIGLYGVIAYSVGQRRQEVGIRRALGAQGGDILMLILSQGVILAVIGIAVGVAGALSLTRVMSTLLFHVSATDPLTFVGLAGMFLLIAIVASYIPARRALRFDPMVTLRM